MIKSIRSNNPLFKTVEFHEGYNIILADRKNTGKADDQKKTRNGAGKTTLVEIIHFCLGANVDKTSVFKSEHLNGWSFTLTVDLNGKTIALERHTGRPNRIYVTGEYSQFNWELKYDAETRQNFFSPSNLNATFRNDYFGIDEGMYDAKYVPSFRELISYIIRKTVDGYRNAFEYYPQQKAYSRQACNAYFLGLSIEYASEFQEIKDRSKGLDDYKNAAKAGVIGDFSLSIGELNTELITRQRDLEKLKSQIDSFQVHPQYSIIAKEADDYTLRIHELSNTLAIRKQLLTRYENSVHEEQTSIPVDNIENLYAEAGVLFGDELKRKLADVIDFHRSLIINRSEYLSSEITRLKKEIREIEKEIKDLSDKRSEVMSILETHGALEEYTQMQDRYAEAKQLYEDTNRRLKSAEYVEDEKSKLKIENQELLIKSRQDYSERRVARERAISIFKANTEFLYPEAGTLTIDLKETGYAFDIEIKSSKSQGVGYMKVFCYDMLISELGIEKTRFPDFLVHDSTIFDGVDERQIAKALVLAKNKCEENGFQYICMMNSDMIPSGEFEEGFEKVFEESVVLRLDDETEHGGLLGIRF